VNVNQSYSGVTGERTARTTDFIPALAYHER
jgi:hypothetical protein